MIENKKILSVITARAGSKGIPLKNVKPLLGKPLVQWSIEASLASKYVDITVVSSNCPEVENVYLKMILDKKRFPGAVPNFWFIKRPDEYATDTSKNEEAMIHAIREVESITGLHATKKMKGIKDFTPDFVVNLQPTSAIRRNGLLDCCIEKYYNGDYDSLLTGKKITPFMWKKINGEWEYINKDDYCKRKMRQELEKNEFLWHDCGSVYITDTRVMIGTECRIGKKPCVFTVDKLNSLQIDTEFDFKLIENMAKTYGLSSLI